MSDDFTDRDMEGATMQVVLDNRLVALYNTPFLDKRLDLEIRGLLITLLTAGRSEFKIGDIRKMGVGRDKARHWLNILEQAGYARRIKTRKRDGTFDWSFQIYNVPYVPPTENQAMAYPPPDFQYGITGNQARRTENQSLPTAEIRANGVSSLYDHIYIKRETPEYIALVNAVCTTSRKPDPGLLKEDDYTQIDVLHDLGVTPEEVALFYSMKDDSYWRSRDFRGRKGQAPLHLSFYTSTILDAREWHKLQQATAPADRQSPNGSGKTTSQVAAESAWQEVIAWLNKGRGKPEFGHASTLAAVRDIGGEHVLRTAGNDDLARLRSQFIQKFTQRQREVAQ